LQILNNRGRVIVRGSGSFGPEQTAVTTTELHRDHTRAVVVGTDSGELVAFDPKGKRLWESNVGDRVTTLRCDIVAGEPNIIAASESGYVWALDTAGKPVWKRNLGEPVKRLVRGGDAYFAAASANGVVRLSLNGKVEAVAPAPAAVTDLTVCGDKLVALVADGSAIGVATK
ncbi:MAG: PQQ-binding-like beta-propeller repeat protein, partial [Verrucomicrobiae bacterium]|nr:PQQ-binding-like beta-propeller repeat protein [Verrucomicrobiae bacterium]